VKSKQTYVSALKIADDKGDIDELVGFLQRETFRAIESLLAYTTDPTSLFVVSISIALESKVNKKRSE
jgi:hypothetical protein